MQHRKRIEHVVDHSTVDAWSDAFALLEFNRYEGQAVRGFLEEMEHLIEHRDDVDLLRSGFAVDPRTGRQWPDDRQKRRLYSSTKIYFDTYYSALSHLSSVVARFSKIFGGVAYTENKPFLTWLEKYHADLPAHFNVGSLVFHELESARRFRALLNHPQQFSPPDWSTETRPFYDVVHIVMHGAQSRTGKIPPGSRHDMIPPFVEADWRMDAPDEVSVTNCLTNVAAPILSAVLAQRRPDAAFVNADSRKAASDATVLTGGRRLRPGSNISTPQPVKPTARDVHVVRGEVASWLKSRGGTW